MIFENGRIVNIKIQEPLSEQSLYFGSGGRIACHSTSLSSACQGTRNKCRFAKNLYRFPAYLYRLIDR